MDPNHFYNHYIAQDFEQDYVPHQFESISREYLIRQNRQGKLPLLFDSIGKYYYDLPKEHRNGAFDIVTHDERGYIFYEAKFRKDPITEQMMVHEIEQVNATGLYCYRYGFFSRSGYESSPRSDIITYDLNNLYETLPD